MGTEESHIRWSKSHDRYVFRQEFISEEEVNTSQHDADQSNSDSQSEGATNFESSDVESNMGSVNGSNPESIHKEESNPQSIREERSNSDSDVKSDSGYLADNEWDSENRLKRKYTSDSESEIRENKNRKF